MLIVANLRCRKTCVAKGYNHSHPHTVQSWQGETLVGSIEHLSLDGAREIARTNSGAIGDLCRIMDEVSDYCEIWKDGSLDRCGTFGQATLVSS